MSVHEPTVTVTLALMALKVNLVTDVDTHFGLAVG